MAVEQIKGDSQAQLAKYRQLAEAAIEADSVFELPETPGWVYFPESELTPQGIQKVGARGVLAVPTPVILSYVAHLLTMTAAGVQLQHLPPRQRKLET